MKKGEVNLNCLYGTTSVYTSQLAKGFGEAAKYPLAWEVIFVNNANGHTFLKNILHVFNSVGKTDGFILDIIGEGTEAVRCLECVFRDKASFKKVLVQGMNDLAVFDEQNNCFVRKADLLEEAERITGDIDLEAV